MTLRLYLLALLLSGCTPYQEIPVACDMINPSINGGVSCFWNGEEQTYYECPEGIEEWSTGSCDYVLCMKKRNIGVLLRSQYPSDIAPASQGIGEAPTPSFK